MKKRLQMLVALIIMATVGHAKIFINQPFAGSSMPAGWKTLILQGSQGWKIRQVPPMGSTSGGYYAVFDDYELGASTSPNEAVLMTPAFNTLGQSKITLKFQQYWFAVEQTGAYVEVSNDNGATWNEVAFYQMNTIGSVDAPEETTLDISAYAADQANVKVRFRYTDGDVGGRYWYIDDVRIYSENDVHLKSIANPLVNIGCGHYTANESIQVVLENLSFDPIQNLSLSLDITGPNSLNVTETFPLLNPNESITYTFAPDIDMSVSGVYAFTITANVAGDADPTNNTLIDAFAEAINTFPYETDFNTNTSAWHNTQGHFQYGVLPDDVLGGAEGNGACWYNISTSSGSWLESPVFDLSNVTNPILSFDIKAQQYSYSYIEYSINGGNWQRLGVYNDPNWYDNSNGWVNTYLEWTTMQHDLCQLSGEPCVRFRVSIYGKQFAIDNFKIDAGEQDQLTMVGYRTTTPVSYTCPPQGGSATEGMQLSFENKTCRNIYNLPIKVEVTHNGNTQVINEVIAGHINRFAITPIDITGTFDMSQMGTYHYKITMDWPNNANPADNIWEFDQERSEAVNSFPYETNFNSSAGGWQTTQGHLQYGILPDNVLGGAEGNGACWYNISTSSGSWLESPVFDLSNVTNPILSFDIKAQQYSYSYIEYSVNGGNWQRLGVYNDPNWYDNSNGWVNTYSEWTTMQHDLCQLSGEPCVRFRVSIYGKQFAIDNFKIDAGEQDQLTMVGYRTTTPVSYTCPPQGGSTTEGMQLSFENKTCRNIYNLPIRVEVTHNGATQVIEDVIAGPINRRATTSIDINGAFDMSQMGMYHYKITMDWPNNANPADNIWEFDQERSEVINTFPYTTDFNTNAGGWQTTQGNLQYGILSDNVLGGSAGNGACWYNTVGGYNYLESPVFDLSGVTNPVLSFDIKAQQYSHSQIQYSVNGGNWQILGAVSDYNWYDHNQHLWHNTAYLEWINMQHNLCQLSGESCIRFRVLTQGKFAIDNFKIEGNDSPVHIQELVDFTSPILTNCLFPDNPDITVNYRYSYTLPCNGPVMGIPIRLEITEPDGTVHTFDETITQEGGFSGNGLGEYTFTNSIPMQALGDYVIKCSFTNPPVGDEVVEITKTIHIDRPILTNFPYEEDFNADEGFWQNTQGNFQYGVLPDDVLGGSDGNGPCWYNTGGGYNYLETPVLDLSSLESPYLSLDIKAQKGSVSSIQYSINGGNWNNLGSDKDINWYDGYVLHSGPHHPYATYHWVSQEYSKWTKMQRSLCGFSGQKCVRFRVYTKGQFAIDNFKIEDKGGTSIHMQELLSFTKPELTGCLFPDSPDIAVEYRYTYAQPCGEVVTSIPVHLEVTDPDGTVHSFDETIAPSGGLTGNGTRVYTFTNKVPMQALGDYVLKCSFTEPQVGHEAIEITKTIHIDRPILTNFPYEEDFNTDEGFWQKSQGNFQYGELPNDVLGGADGNGACWYNIDDGYNYVESPVFDLSNVESPYLSFDIKAEPYSASWVEYSANGSGWKRLGTINDINWYDHHQYGWYTEKSYLEWTKMQRSLCGLSGQKCVRFRVRAYRKFAIDNFKIEDKGTTPVHMQELVSFTKPNQPSACMFPENPDITIKYRYTYTQPCDEVVTSFPVHLEIADPDGTVHTFDATITKEGGFTGNGWGEYTFPYNVPMQEVGDYVLTCTLGTPQVGHEVIEISKTIHIDRSLESAPYTQDFNTDNGGWVSTSEQAFTYGELPADILNGTGGEGNSWYANPTVDNQTMILESPVFDLSQIEHPYLSFNIKHKLASWAYGRKYKKYWHYTHYNIVLLQYSINGGNWTTLGTTSDLNWYNAPLRLSSHPHSAYSSAWGYTAGEDEFPVNHIWQRVYHDLCGIAGNSCVRFRLFFKNAKVGSHFAIDNFKIEDRAEPTRQQALTEFKSPVVTDCLFPEDAPVTVGFRYTYNHPCDDVVTSVPIRLEVETPDGTTITHDESITGNFEDNGTIDYTFAHKIPMYDKGDYHFKAYLLTTDFNADNDTIKNTITLDRPLINSFPYAEDFNTDEGGWLSTSNAAFTYGELPDAILNGAEEEGNSWYKTGNGTFILESPVFDMSSTQNPQISFFIKSSQNNQAYIDYSIDGGAWQRLGTASDEDWYNYGNVWYQQEISTWTNVRHDLCPLKGQSCVRFRIVARYNGDFAMDNITITDTPVDAEIVALNGCWGSPYKMEVTVRNNDLGCANTPVINSLDIVYTTDGGLPITETITGLNIPSGGVAVVEVGDVNLPKETTVVNVKVKRPNGLEDKFVENDEWETDATQWSNCNDHCSNVIEIGLGTTKAAETSWANYDPSEDPNFTGCVDVTLENTVWYKFTTNDSGLPIKMKVSQQVCSPELKGIQLTVLKAGTPCDPTTYEENYFCSYTENTDAFEWDAGPLEPNTTYYIAIDGVGNSSCDFYITLEGGVDKIDGIAGPDKLVCSDESVLLGIESNPSYTYTWTEVTPGTIGYLDDVHLAQPTFQYTGAPLTTPLQIKYELAVRRNGHYIGIDEMEVTVRNCLNAVNDINQTPQELLVEGNVLTNDDGEGITVSEASIEVSGIVYTLTLGTEETIPNIGHITMYADGIYTFEPTDNFAQKVPDIVYTLQDTDGDTDTAILSIQVVPEPHNEENNLPIAQNDTYTIEQTQTAYITVLANDSDLDNDALSLMEVRAHGVGNATAILNSTPQDIYDESGTNAIGVASVDSEGRIVFTPTADFIGDVPFDYVLSDGNGGTNTAQVVLAVLLSNSTDNIYTNDDAVIGKKGQIITGTVKANDKIESSQNTLTVNNIPIGGDNTVIPLPSETGTLKMNMDGTYEFVPHANFSGTVVLVYEICNDEGYCDKATLYLTTLTRIDCSFIRANIHVTRPLIK